MDKELSTYPPVFGVTDGPRSADVVVSPCSNHSKTEHSILPEYDPTVNLDELQWFVVLAQTEHVTDAAAELHLTQPTLSRALARMERQVGALLFDRVNYSTGCKNGD